MQTKLYYIIYYNIHSTRLFLLFFIFERLCNITLQPKSDGLYRVRTNCTLITDLAVRINIIIG